MKRTIFAIVLFGLLAALSSSIVQDAVIAQPTSIPSQTSVSTQKTLFSRIAQLLSPQTQRSFITKHLRDEPSLLFILMIAFFAGLLTSLTPCVYPLIPLTAGIMQAQATRSRTFNFFLCLCYVFGTAIAYGLLGFLVTGSKWLFGRQILFGQWLASPWFMLTIILFFLYFALSMLGLYEIYIPKFLQQRRNVKVNGSLIYSFFSGLVAGTVSSPCTGPVLGALILIAMQLNNPFFAFITFSSFALGMGVLLLIVGTWAAAIDTLPQAGHWMLEVKKIFGFALLGVCIYLLTLNPTIYAGLARFLRMTLADTRDATTWLLISLLLLAAACYYIISGWQQRWGRLNTKPLSIEQVDALSHQRPKQKQTKKIALQKSTLSYSWVSCFKIIIGLVLLFAAVLTLHRAQRPRALVKEIKETE